ncbi:hypothetical protein [Streptomyces shenzhenensis]|uniref:hypothetical protein n=1 Tax=Streptomyces shenzhenensis TaxID=943815 RepID=UPI001F158F5D|nr:hypothetical protein [Streptomyces shenzhenensis]
MTDHVPETAFADPATVRAWRKERRRSFVKLILWMFCLLGYAAVLSTVEDRVGKPLAFIFSVPIVLVIAVGIGFVSVRWEHLGKMRAVLKAYPWQHCPPLGVNSLADIEYFRLPDPDEPRKNIQVAFRRYGTGRSWQRAVEEARSEGFTFAGDPRYACVVALPGLRRLLAVRPQHLHLGRDGARPRTVSETAWRRAQEAGITAPPSLEEQRRKQLYLLWKALRSRPSSR